MSVGGTSYRCSATLEYLATPAPLSPQVGKQNQRSLKTSYGHTVRKDKAQTRTQGRLGQGLRGSFTHPLSFTYCLNQSHTHSLSHQLFHSFTLSLIRLPIHSRIHSLTHLLSHTGPVHHLLIDLSAHLLRLPWAECEGIHICCTCSFASDTGQIDSRKAFPLDTPRSLGTPKLNVPSYIWHQQRGQTGIEVVRTKKGRGPWTAAFVYLYCSPQSLHSVCWEPLSEPTCEMCTPSFPCSGHCAVFWSLCGC